MGLTLLSERHHQQIAGVISCYDRILIQGTLPGLCYAEGMTSYLYARQIRIFDYPRLAQSLRDQLRENAERLAAENGLEIRVHSAHQKFSQEGEGPTNSAPARFALGPGLHLLGHEALWQLSTLAQQADAQDLLAPPRRQVLFPQWIQQLRVLAH